MRPLFKAISKEMAEIHMSFEIIFVDDGSTDGSWEILKELEGLESDSAQVKLIRFRSNFGKASALDAGFSVAKGDIVFSMDADLQDDPSEIKSFLQKLAEGFDVVSGWKQKRKDPLGKTLPSRLFNFAVRLVSGVNLRDFNCGFKAYRAEAIHKLRLYGDLHRFIPVILHYRGFRVGEVPVKHHPRRAGISKYGWERFARGFFDLMTVMLTSRYQSRPLHLFGWAGLLMASFGFLILLHLAILWFSQIPIDGRPLFFLGILLMVLGVQLIGFGLLGELINYYQGQASTAHFISEARGFEEDRRGSASVERYDQAREFKIRIPNQD